MKSTIPLSGERKAVVDIPNSKLVPVQDKSKEAPLHSCCESKIVVTGGGSSKSSSKLEIRRMVEEMEEAYDKDVKALQAKIGQVEHNKAAASAQWQKERRELHGEFGTKRSSYQKQIELLREQCRKKDTQIRRIHQQKQLLLRSKINEFKQVQYIDRLSQLDHIVRLKDCQIKQLTAKHDLLSIERLRIQQQSRNSQLKLQSQINRLSLQLSITTNSFVNQQSSMVYTSKLKEEQSNKLIQQLKQQLQKTEAALRQSQWSREAKGKQILALNQKVNSSQQKVGELESQTTQLKDSISQLITLRHELSEDVAVCQRTIVFLTGEKDRLLIELDGRFGEIDKLRRDLYEKERVYEVKIERVIDGKEQIEQLKATIFQQQQQITKLNQQKQYLAQDIAKLKGELQSGSQDRLKLEAQISGLKAYISKCQGSFRWAVERQIEKDILVNGERPQSYKVSHVGEYSRTKNEETHANQIISQQIGIQMQANMFGNYPEQIILQKFRQ